VRPASSSLANGSVGTAARLDSDGNADIESEGVDLLAYLLGQDFEGTATTFAGNPWGSDR
jgi:hypothetical protein